MTPDAIFAVRSINRTNYVPLFTFNRAVWNDWCLQCIARRLILGTAASLLIYGLCIPHFVQAQSDPTAAELQREVQEFRGQVSQLPAQIQGLAVQVAVLADRSSKQEERDKSTDTEIKTIMGGGILLALERLYAAFGGRIRDSARDHEPANRRAT